MLIALLGGLGGWFVAQGALDVLLGQQSLNQPGWVWLGLGLLIGLPGAIIVQRRSTRVRDPRTGADMVPMSGWGVGALIGTPIAIVLLAWGAIKLFN